MSNCCAAILGCEGAGWASMRTHRIASELMLDLGSSSKLNAEWDFLTMLRDEVAKPPKRSCTGTATTLARVSSLNLDKLLQGV
jgi:NTE family protein